MKPNLIISDWNGTLIADPDDKPVLKQIAMDELKHAASHFNVGRVWQLVTTRKKLEAMVKRYREDPQQQAELLRATYDLYNSNVIGGMPLERISRSIGRYADSAVARLDGAFDEFYEAALGINARILTSALDDGVLSVLRSKLFGKEWFNHFRLYGSSIIQECDCKEWFNHFRLYGSSITQESDGKAESIWLRNYDNRAAVLKGIIDSIALDSRDTDVSSPVSVFMGNDFKDEPCADIADRFVVAPLATDEYRQHMASEYGSKVRTPNRGEVYDALTMD